MLRSSIIMTRKISPSLHQFRMWGLLAPSPGTIIRRCESYREMKEFFPNTPDCRLKHLYNPHDDIHYRQALFDDERVTQQYKENPNYPSYITQVSNVWSTRKTSSGEEGNFLDVCRLLSFSNISPRNYLVNKRGEPVPLSSLTGKHVVVCCCFVPLHKENGHTDILKAIHSSYLELCVSRSDVQLVMVAKIRKYWTDQGEAVFNHFFSGLPHDCLAIPFDDLYSREAVCKSVGLGTPCRKSLAALVVHPDGQVLNKQLEQDVTDSGAPSFFSSYYRRTLVSRMLDIKLWLHLIQARGYGGVEGISRFYCLPSLEEILECNSLRTFGSDEEVQLSDLRNSLVGVYFCHDGRFLDELNDVHHQCLAQGRDFVIVLVCLPFEQEPSAFCNHIKDAMEKRSISSWLVFPFKDSICRWLWTLSGWSDTDQLIILPHVDKSGKLKLGEIQGKAVIKQFGASAYPFTKESILEDKLSYLKSINLMTLLQEFTHLVRHNNGSQTNVPVEDVRGRNILLYIDSVAKLETHLYDKLLGRYQDIKTKYPSSEVVFVPLDSSDHEDARVSEMPWLKLPSFSASLTKQLCFEDTQWGDAQYPTLLAFGESGNLVRRFGSHLGDVDDLFHDNLEKELVAALSYIECPWS